MGGLDANGNALPFNAARSGSSAIVKEVSSFRAATLLWYGVRQSRAVHLHHYIIALRCGLLIMAHAHSYWHI
jgi:hypothetical protein